MTLTNRAEYERIRAEYAQYISGNPVGGADTPGWPTLAAASQQRMAKWQRWVVKIALILGFRDWATRRTLYWDPATRYALAKLFRHSGNYSGGGHR